MEWGDPEDWVSIDGIRPRQRTLRFDTVTRHRKVVRVFDPELTELHHKVLRLLGVPSSAYSGRRRQKGPKKRQRYAGAELRKVGKGAASNPNLFALRIARARVYLGTRSTSKARTGWGRSLFLAGWRTA